MLEIRRVAGIVTLLGAGCAARHPATYRLLSPNSASVLIPPGVASADLTQRTFEIDAVRGAGPCPRRTGGIVIDHSKRRFRVTVRRDALVNQPAGWLAGLTDALEPQGCLKPGTSMSVAASLAEAVPLDPQQSFRLLYSSSGGEMLPQTRIQVVNPILRPDAAGPPTEANVLGVETAWYVVQPPRKGDGLVIAPLSAERSENGRTERLARPSVNPFQFAPEASFYRLIYKQDQTGLTAWVAAARTRAELDQRTQAMGAGTVSCDTLTPAWCVIIPKIAAVNVLLPVTVNGQEVLIHWGGNVGEAVRSAGEPAAESVLPHLTVERLYRGKLARIEFDRGSRAILNLPLIGGEVISWK